MTPSGSSARPSEGASDRRSVAAASNGAELEGFLLDGKLSVPRVRTGSVSRADLIEAARAGECRVVGITAPAGYGKSTLMAEWAEADDRRVAWVSLDRLDDDPAALLFLLASAYGRISGQPDLIAGVGGLSVSALGRAAPRLASALRTSPMPFLLILDDLHELRSPACHDVLSVVISGIPPGSQLVAASRSEQPHLPRLRASGDAVEITATDLALDAAAAEQIFAEAHVNLTREQAAAVTARTEGWPVGLQLAALIAGDRRADGLTIAGDDRYVADYLYRESLLQLPAQVQRFLRRTAVLDQLSAPLCDAVLDEPGSSARLRDLEASSMFLVPLDRRRGWYRYHALFREFLLAELQRVEPDVVAKLHLRAADWYQSNGSPRLALEHLLNTTERDRCAQLMAQFILPTFQAGQVSTAQRWLATLGPSAIEQYPPLAVLAGWIAVLTGETADAQRWAAFLDTVSFDPVPVDGSASFHSARALLRALMCAAGPEQMAADARELLHSRESRDPNRPHSIDYAGTVLIALTLAPFVLAVSEGSDWGWVSLATLACLAVAVGSGFAFVAVEKRVAVPLLDLALLRNRILVGATIAILIGAGTINGLMYLLSLYFQDPNTLGFTPLQAGLATLPGDCRPGRDCATRTSARGQVRWPSGHRIGFRRHFGWLRRDGFRPALVALSGVPAAPGRGGRGDGIVQRTCVLGGDSLRCGRAGRGGVRGLEYGPLRRGGGGDRTGRDDLRHGDRKPDSQWQYGFRGSFIRPGSGVVGDGGLQRRRCSHGGRDGPPPRGQGNRA